MCSCNKLKITKTAGKPTKEAKSGKPAKIQIKKKPKLPKK